MATLAEQIHEAQALIAQQIQEGAVCANPEHLGKLNKILGELDKRKQLQIAADGSSNQVFRINSRGFV